MSTTIDTSFSMQSSYQQTVTSSESGVSTTEESVGEVSTIPVDSVEISDEAKALAQGDEDSSSSESSEESTQAGGAGGAGGVSGSSSSSLEAQIEALEEKIAELEKEIARGKQTEDEQSGKEVQLKEALLASYQAQLSALESQMSESS